MVCHGAQLMGCPKCGELFCVPAVVGSATVFHAPCSVALTLRLVADSCSEVIRGWWCGTGIIISWRWPLPQTEGAYAAQGK